MRTGALAAIILCAAAALPATAQTSAPLTPLQIAAGCAPIPAGSLPPDAIRIVGAQDSKIRIVFAPRDIVILNGGAARGVQLNDRYYVRRAPSGYVRHVGPRGANTIGWLRIVAVNAETALGLVEFTCDGMLVGDILQAYADPMLPPNADRTDTAGEPDFNGAGRVLFGDSERLSGATGDFMISTLGSASGVAPGSRFAIYRNVGGGIPLAAVGEAVATRVDQDFSVVRVTRSRDAIRSGDLLVPRRRP